MTFGEKIKTLRDKKGITQNQLAEALGITQRIVSYYETGRSIPNNTDILNKIATFFNVTLDYLLLDKETPNETSKLHKLIKKLTNETISKKIRWINLVSFYEGNNNEELTNLNDFITNLQQYKKIDTIDCENSYVFYQNNGAYLVIKIIIEKEIDIALIIDYEDSFHYMANMHTIQSLEELYFHIANSQSNIDEFIDEYLNDKPSEAFPDEEIPF